MINENFLEKLLTKSRSLPDHLKSKHQLYFEIDFPQKDGSTRKVYLLGTDHGIPLYTFPEPVIKHIASLGTLFTETGSQDESSEKTIFRNNFKSMFGRRDDDRWVELLSDRDKRFVENIFKDVCKYRYGEEYVPDVTYENICFDFVRIMIDKALLKELDKAEAILSIDESSHQSDSDPEFTWMDADLGKLFLGGYKRLESSLTHHIFNLYCTMMGDDSFYEMFPELEFANEHELFLKKIEIAQTIKVINKIAIQDKRRALAIMKSHHPIIYDMVFEGAVDSEEGNNQYTTNDELSDFATTWEIDHDGESSQQHARNIIMFKNLIQYSKTCERPLFAVGSSHLCGETGFLTMLRKNGVSVKRFCTQGAGRDNCFEPYVYPYPEYLFAYRKIKEQILSPQFKVNGSRHTPRLL